MVLILVKSTILLGLGHKSEYSENLSWYIIADHEMKMSITFKDTLLRYFCRINWL